MQLANNIFYGSGLGISAFSQINSKSNKSIFIKTQGQLLLVDYGLMLGDKVFRNLYGTPLAGRVSPWLLRGILHSPLILAFFSANTNQSTWYGKAVTLIHTHLETISLIVINVSAVALIFFGSQAIGISFLAGSAYELLCQHKIIPTSIDSMTVLVRRAFSISYSLFFCSWLSKIIVITQLVFTYILKIDSENLIEKYLQGRHLDRNMEKTPLTNEMISSILNNKFPHELVEINYSHLNEKGSDVLAREIFSTLKKYRRQVCEKIFETFVVTHNSLQICQIFFGNLFTLSFKNVFMHYLQKPFAYSFKEEKMFLIPLGVEIFMLKNRKQIDARFHKTMSVFGTKIELANGEKRAIERNDLLLNNLKVSDSDYYFDSYTINSLIYELKKKIFETTESPSDNRLSQYLFKVLKEKQLDKLHIDEKDVSIKKKLIILTLIHLGVFNFKP